MANPREVKQRIKSLKDILQMASAIQAVSTSKVRKAVDSLEQSRPYLIKSWQVLKHIAEQPEWEDLHPLLKHVEVCQNVLVVLISGDRGLAGAYYDNIVRYLLKEFEGYTIPVKYVTVGRKGRDHLHRYGKEIIAEFSDLPDQPGYSDVSAIGRLVLDEFLEQEACEIHLVYTRFVNMMSQIPTDKKLLPLEPTIEERVPAIEESDYPAGPYIYEPNKHEILDAIIPRFTILQVYHAVLEALASEYAARRVAMKTATSNARDLVDALQLEYNKARQQAITKEMLDIVGGRGSVEKQRGKKEQD
jgi:F-type H+-transporting ATPase subunit gamma